MKKANFLLKLQNNYLTKKKITKSHDFQVLRAYLPKIFPPKCSIEVFWKILESNKNQFVNDSYTVVDLPKHTQDIQWLTYYIDRLINLTVHGYDNTKVSRENIKAFIETDPEFIVERNRYEEDIVSLLIQKLMTERKFGFANDDIMNLKMNFTVNTDEIFRQEITTQATKIGIGSISIETGLEKNADLWREQTMETEFINRYIRPIVSQRENVNGKNFVEILSKVSAMRNEWIALRENEYYQKHKAVIDFLDLATYDMKLKPREIQLRKRTFDDKYSQITAPLFDKLMQKNVNLGHEQI